MTKSKLRFYRRYYEDGSCKVICMDCYDTLGTGENRHDVARMEARHVCSHALLPADAAKKNLRAYLLAGVDRVRDAEQWMARLHPALLAILLIVVLYGIPTILEILARQEVNTWVAVILPGNILGCMVLIAILRMPRTGLGIYLALAACECWLHVTHIMRGVTMAWIVDLVPTLVVLILLIVRLPKGGGRQQAAFC